MEFSKLLRFSFRRSLPILIGFCPLGLAYGILMQSAGYNALWSGLCSSLVFAGSLQFLMVEFFQSSVPLVTVAVLSLLLNSRHIFYGISFLEKFRSWGKGAKWALIFTLIDENYSLHCGYRGEPGIDEKWARILTSFLVMSYWVGFSILGGIAGAFLPFDTTGIDFALTALFVVILLEQLQAAKSKLPLGIAAVSSTVCIACFGSERFILPSLLITVAVLTLLRPRLEPALEGGEVAA